MHRPVTHESTWLDSPLTSDDALNNPDALVSRRIKQPSLNQQQSPVCVLVHGFSASSYEFESLKASLLAHDPDLLFSAVVMGGHGRDYESFKSASYQDWLKPIVAGTIVGLEWPSADYFNWSINEVLQGFCTC